MLAYCIFAPLLTLLSHYLAFHLGYPAVAFFAYPAVPLFFCALTLLCSYFSSHLPCCALILLRTYPAYEEVFGASRTWFAAANPDAGQIRQPLRDLSCNVKAQIWSFQRQELGIILTVPS